MFRVVSEAVSSLTTLRILIAWSFFCCLYIVRSPRIYFSWPFIFRLFLLPCGQTQACYGKFLSSCASCNWIISVSNVITDCSHLSHKHCVFSVCRKKCPMRKGPVKVGSLPQWKWQISLWMRLYGKQCPKSWSMWEAPMTRVSVPEGCGFGLRGEPCKVFTSLVENTGRGHSAPVTTCFSDMWTCCTDLCPANRLLGIYLF